MGNWELRSWNVSVFLTEPPAGRPFFAIGALVFPFELSIADLRVEHGDCTAFVARLGGVIGEIACLQRGGSSEAPAERGGECERCWCLAAGAEAPDNTTGERGCCGCLEAGAFGSRGTADFGFELGAGETLAFEAGGRFGNGSFTCGVARHAGRTSAAASDAAAARAGTAALGDFRKLTHCGCLGRLVFGDVGADDIRVPKCVVCKSARRAPQAESLKAK